MFYLILPKTLPYLSREKRNLRLYFLMGPILGGDDWHKEMSERLASASPCVVVNPSRYSSEHPHYKRRVEGPEGFETQTLWERHYLRQAALEWRRGCIVCWLPCESDSNPRTDGNPYAMDTRGEIGEWRTHLFYNPRVRFVMGAEPGFPGLRTIQRNFEAALGCAFPIYSTMSELAVRATEVSQS